MSYAIFRVQGIRTTGDLKGIGKHNLERVSYTNLDIDVSMSAENIHLISPPDSKTYMNRFSEIVEPMKLEHEEKMKKERKDRVKSFEAKINSSKSDVASEFLFTSDEKFFEKMNKDQVKEWAETCLDFVKNEIGIKEEQMLHAVVHMDEKTPHLHIVAVPLVKKFDGRAKREVWQINRKHFIGGKEQLSELQDKYHQHMLKHGYDLERGLKGSESRHVNPVKFKAQEEIKKLESKREVLKIEVTDLFQGVEESFHVSKQVDQIPVEEKKAFLGSSKMVKLAVEDFEHIKTLAKVSEVLKTNEKALKNEIKGLKDENIILQNEKEQLRKEKQKLISKNFEMERHYKNQQEQLEKENKRLERELTLKDQYIEYLQRTFEEMKRLSQKYLKVELEKMREFMGKVRMLTVGKIYGGLSVTKENAEAEFLIPADERKSALDYVDFYMQKQKTKMVEQVAEQQTETKYEVEKPKTRDDQGLER